MLIQRWGEEKKRRKRLTWGRAEIQIRGADFTKIIYIYIYLKSLVFHILDTIIVEVVTQLQDELH